MLFSSIPFLYYFLPCVLIMYFLVPRCLKNAVLLLSSLVFYGWGEPIYVVLMIVSILVGYISGLLVEKFRGSVYSKVSMWTGILICFGFLAYYKYANFFIDNFNAITGLSVPFLKLFLPIGISFYTFQIASYIIDVYRGTTCAQRNFINLAAYVTMFPQLIAGPIVRYVDIEVQLRERNHTFEKISLGIRRFVLGLGKKILIANALGEICDMFKTVSVEHSVAFAWMYGIAFSFHIYFDFSGYSDMAIGLGHILGFDFLENFNYPYISKSVTEFWRRWHMSLGSWFRDYVYIPLGGNRVNTARWFFNIFVVWLFTGFWHGAAWNFIVWGLMFAVLLVAEKFFLGKWLKKSRVFSRIYLLFTVMISFIIFNADTMRQAFMHIGELFGAGNIPLITEEAVYYLRSFASVYVLAFIGATPFAKNLINKIKTTKIGEMAITAAEPVFLVTLLIVMTGYLVDGSFNPFLYFRF